MNDPQTPRTAAGRLEAATPHGRSMHQRFHKGSCPSEYGEDCWQLQDIIAIEAEAATGAKPDLLDVDLLQRALPNEIWDYDGYPGNPDHLAADIAAEYARLAASKEQG